MWEKIGYASRTYKGDQVGQLGQISYWYDVCTVQVWHTTRFDLIPGTTYRVLGDLKYFLNSSMIPHSGSDGHLWPLGQTWIGNKLPNHMLARVKNQSSPIIGIELWKYFHKNHHSVKIFLWKLPHCVNIFINITSLWEYFSKNHHFVKIFP